MRFARLTVTLAGIALPAVAQAQPPAASLPPVAGPQQPSAPANSSDMPDADPQQVGRFQIVLVPTALAGSIVYAPFQMLLDTATGQTWMLPPVTPDQRPMGVPLNYLANPAAAGAAPPAR